MNEHPDLPRTAGRRTGDFAVTRRTAALALAGALALIIGLWELSGRGSLNPILQPAEAAAKAQRTPRRRRRTRPAAAKQLRLAKGTP